MDNQKIMIKLINEIDNIISDIYDLDDLLLPESVENLEDSYYDLLFSCIMTIREENAKLIEKIENI